jgi:CheY-like chemotaxis protein
MNVARIVVIEDNPADVQLIEMALRENAIPYAMTRFETGEDALDALCSPGASTIPIDAILLDLNTPKSDGFNVLGRLRGTPHLADVPIAILSSSQARSDKQRTALLGAVRYIEKPSQLEPFLKTVSDAVKAMLHA